MSTRCHPPPHTPAPTEPTWSAFLAAATATIRCWGWRTRPLRSTLHVCTCDGAFLQREGPESKPAIAYPAPEGSCVGMVRATRADSVNSVNRVCSAPRPHSGRRAGGIRIRIDARRGARVKSADARERTQAQTTRSTPQNTMHMRVVWYARPSEDPSIMAALASRGRATWCAASPRRGSWSCGRWAASISGCLAPDFRHGG